MVAVDTHFTDNILVACPRCASAAYVSNGVRMVCPSCGLHHQRLNPRRFGDNGICFERSTVLRDWYGWLKPVICNDDRCSRCGNALALALTPQLREKIPQINTQAIGCCQTCGATQAVGITWLPFAVADQPYDCYFGAGLFLVEHSAKGTLFALNKAHAQQLLDYISRGLRCDVDGADVGRFSILPTWIKLAKNRQLVERMLKRMIEKCSLTSS